MFCVSFLKNNAGRCRSERYWKSFFSFRSALFYYLCKLEEGRDDLRLFFRDDSVYFRYKVIFSDGVYATFRVIPDRYVHDDDLDPVSDSSDEGENK